MLISFLWLSTIIFVFLFAIWTKKNWLNFILKLTFFAATILGVVNLFKYYN